MRLILLRRGRNDYLDSECHLRTPYLLGILLPKLFLYVIIAQSHHTHCCLEFVMLSMTLWFQWHYQIDFSPNGQDEA